MCWGMQLKLASERVVNYFGNLLLTKRYLINAIHISLENR